MKSLTLLIVTIGFTQLTQCQSSADFDLDMTNPESVVNVIFHAAKTQDFSLLENICDPKGEGDGDTRRICELSALAQAIKDEGRQLDPAKDLKGFIPIFKPGKINGDVKYETSNGKEMALVPFWFKHPSGGKRENETMKLVKRGENWYLYSF